MPDPKKKQGLGPSIELKDDLSNVNEWLNYQNTVVHPRRNDEVPADFDIRNDPSQIRERKEANTFLSGILDKPKPPSLYEKLLGMVSNFGNPQVHVLDDSRQANQQGMAALDALQQYPEAAKKVKNVYTGIKYDPFAKQIADYHYPSGDIKISNNVPNYLSAKEVMLHEMSHGMGLPDNYNDKNLYPTAQDVSLAADNLNLGNRSGIDRRLPYEPTTGIGPTPAALVKRKK